MSLLECGGKIDFFARPGLSVPGHGRAGLSLPGWGLPEHGRKGGITARAWCGGGGGWLSLLGQRWMGDVFVLTLVLVFFLFD